MGFRTPTFGQFNQQQQAQDKEEMQPIGKRQKGTGFTNIGKILGANIGAGERIGGQVGKGIGAQAGQLKMGTTEAQKKFQQSREEAAGKAREAIGGIGQYLGNEAGLAGMTEEQAKAAREKFQKEGTYTGPSGIQDQAQLQARSQALGGLAGTAMSGAAGERGLLRSMVAGPGMYTRGQSLLDTALLGQSEAGKRAIRSAAQQASTAARTTGAAIAGAEEQAAATQKSLEKERAEVAKKTGEKLEEVEKAGGESAKQFADDINRFNKLVGATKSLDKEGNPVYTDVEGNIINLTDRDRELISNPERFGLKAGEIELIGSQASGEDPLNILRQLASTSGFTYQTGMRQYSPEQQAIARNLALFKGETPSEYSAIDTDIYKAGAQNIAQKADAYNAMIANREGRLRGIQSDLFSTLKKDLYLPQQTSDRIQTEQQLLDYINQRSQNQYGIGNAGSLSEYAKKLIDYYKDKPVLGGKFGWSIDKYKDLLGRQESEQQKSTLKDYLANLYKK
jgi:hypothetical protein